MFAFPMLIVWIILAGVLICVMAAAIVTKVRGESIGVNPLTLLAVVIFVTSVLGYFVTGFASPTPETWTQAPWFGFVAVRGGFCWLLQWN
jgi:hypothetical protein